MAVMGNQELNKWKKNLKKEQSEDVFTNDYEKELSTERERSYQTGIHAGMLKGQIVEMQKMLEAPKKSFWPFGKKKN